MKKSIFDYTCEAKKSEGISDDFYVSNGKVVKGDPEDQAGMDAEDNDSDGTWEVEAPTEDDLLEDLDMEHADRNKKNLVLKMKTKRPFFIQGRAGWGKTTLITKIAKKFNRSVITVYLDKAEATDLGGIPVPIQDKKTRKTTIHTAMPGWASIMYRHPENQYLLFFDELNHANSEILHALMPIVLKNVICGQQFTNFIVGAAGNLQEEDDLEELPTPLVSRFKPLIQWETHTQETWNSAFKHLHKQWDSKLGEDLVNQVQDYCILFDNPREIELNILSWVDELVKEGGNEWLDIEDVQLQIEGLAAEDREGIAHYDEKRKQEAIGTLAEYILAYIKGGGQQSVKEEPTGRMAKNNLKGSANGTIDPEVLDDIKYYLQQGWVRIDKKKYGVALENIQQVAVNKDQSPLTSQQITWLMKNLKTLGITARFETIADFKKEGYFEEGE